MKPGWKTSEFWLLVSQVMSSISSVVYALQTINTINSDPRYSTALVVVATVANALSISAYSNSRSDQKIACIATQATSSLPQGELAG